MRLKGSNPGIPAIVMGSKRLIIDLGVRIHRFEVIIGLERILLRDRKVMLARMDDDWGHLETYLSTSVGALAHRGRRCRWGG